MAAYHMIMEVFNIIHNSSSEQIQNTFIKKDILSEKMQATS